MGVSRAMGFAPTSTTSASIRVANAECDNCLQAGTNDGSLVGFSLALLSI